MPDPPAPPLERILGRPEAGVRSLVDLALRRDPDTHQTVDADPKPSMHGRIARTVHNRPVGVPPADWERVCVGTKRMFRAYSGLPDRFARMFPESETFPRPGIIYKRENARREHQRRVEARVAVLTGYRQEPLGAISPQDLQAEGFATLTDFRRYWRARYQRHGYRPIDVISVVQLRPWTPADDAEQAIWLLRRLYGEFL